MHLNTHADLQLNDICTMKEQNSGTFLNKWSSQLLKPQNTKCFYRCFSPWSISLCIYACEGSGVTLGWDVTGILHDLQPPWVIPPFRVPGMCTGPLAPSVFLSILFLLHSSGCSPCPSMHPLLTVLPLCLVYSHSSSSLAVLCKAFLLEHSPFSLLQAPLCLSLYLPVEFMCHAYFSSQAAWDSKDILFVVTNCCMKLQCYMKRTTTLTA